MADLLTEPAGHLAWNWDQLLIEEQPDPLATFIGLPVGDNGEPWDRDITPWAQEVARWWIDPEVDWIWLIQGSQTGKTTAMMACLLHAAKHAPGPGMWIAAVEDEADKFCVQRLKPFLESADEATRTGRKRDWRSRDLRIYGTMLLHMAWATSPRKLRSWPCRYLFGDECGIWPATLPKIGDPIEYIKKRTRRYRDRKGIFSTTPSTPDHPAWQDATAGNFARWYVPCPHCGEFQYLAWPRIIFAHCKHGDAWDLAAVARDTYYRCEHCEAELYDADRAGMIRAGRIQYVDHETGEPKTLDRGNRTRTLQIPAIYSLWTPLGKLAAGFLSAKQKGPEALRVYVTDELAEPWTQPTDTPALTTIRKAADRDRHRGTVPDEAVALTAGIDIHADLIYYTVRAWGPGPEPASWQVTYGQLPMGQAGLAILDDIILTDYAGHPIDWAYIDSGWKPELVYPYCQQHPRTAPSKGVIGARQTSLVKPSSLEHSKVRNARGLTLYLIHVDHFKAYIHEHLQIKPGDPGAWRILADAEDDEVYLRQILSESRCAQTVAGRTVHRWIITDRAAGNHYLDVEVLAAAAAWYPLRVHRILPTQPPEPEPDRPLKQPNQKTQWIQRSGQWIR